MMNWKERSWSILSHNLSIKCERLKKKSSVRRGGPKTKLKQLYLYLQSSKWLCATYLHRETILC